MTQQINESDIEVLISCIKNSSTKLAPNFEKVAKECGLKDSKAAYMRHWKLMKKFGLTGSSRSQAQKLEQKPEDTTPKKRNATSMEEDENDSGDDKILEEQAAARFSMKNQKRD